MAIGTTATFPKELDKSIDKIFFDNYTEAPTEYDKIAKIVPSFSGSSIKESELSGIGPMRDLTEGDRIQYESLVEGNEKERFATEFGLGFQITQVMYEDDDRHGNIRVASKELSASAAYKRETKFFDLFNNGFATHVAWDGNYIFVAAGRTTLKGGYTNNNRPAVDVALSETAINAMIEYFKTTKGSSGRPIVINLNMLVVPTELSALAWQLHENKMSPGTMDNDLNTLKRDGTWSVHESRHLTSATAFFGLSGDHDMRFVWKRNITLGSSDDFETGNRLYKATGRFSTFCNNPIGCWGTTGA